MPTHRRASSLLAAVLFAATAACSGGGSGGMATTTPVQMPGSGMPGTTGPTVSSATVHVLLTDAHGSDWDRAIATITSIELVGDGGTATLFSGSKKIDLLRLPDFFELFSASDIAPGSFDKIRLQVSSLDLIKLDDHGTEVQRVAADLVGGGKIDIVPQNASFTVGDGATLFLQIDFDMAKTFETAVQTDDGHIRLRPVVFVSIGSRAPSQRLTRIFGDVDSVDAAAQSFVLCQTALAAEHDEDNGADDGNDVTTERAHCVTVEADDATGVFDANGLPVTFADVAAGDELLAIGRLRDRDVNDDAQQGATGMTKDGVAATMDDGGDNGGDEHDGSGGGDHSGDGNGDDGSGGGDDGTNVDGGTTPRHDAEDPDDFVLEAITVELGRNFKRFAGTAQTAVSGDRFDFELGDGQGFATGTVVPAQLAASTRVFSTDGSELDMLSIQPDTRALVDGVISLDQSQDPSLLQAALIVVDTGGAQSEQMLSGTVTSVDAAAGTLQLLAGDTDRCVDAAAADIFVVSNDGGFSSRRASLGDLVADQRADVFGRDSAGGCFSATAILAEAAGGGGS